MELLSATRSRELAESEANYIAHTQELARLSTMTKFVNMDTGEISYATLKEDGQLAAEDIVRHVAQSHTAAPPPPPVDPEVAYRRARLGVVAVIVLVFLWLWIRERRSR